MNSSDFNFQLSITHRFFLYLLSLYFSCQSLQQCPHHFSSLSAIINANFEFQSPTCFFLQRSQVTRTNHIKFFYHCFSIFPYFPLLLSHSIMLQNPSPIGNSASSLMSHQHKIKINNYKFSKPIKLSYIRYTTFIYYNNLHPHSCHFLIAKTL